MSAPDTERGAEIASRLLAAVTLLAPALLIAQTIAWLYRVEFGTVVAAWALLAVIYRATERR